MNYLSIFLLGISGLLSLLYGRRLFWLFVALVGFLAGFILGTTLFPKSPELVHLLTGVGLGLVGALLSRFVPQLVTAMVGFFAGGTVLMQQIEAISPLGQVLKLVVFTIGALLGAFLAVKFFNLALVILSSISGANVLSALGIKLLEYGNDTRLTIFIVLFVVGIIFQLLAVRPHGERKLETETSG